MKKNYYRRKIAVFMFALLLIGCSQESVDEEILPLNGQEQEPPIPENGSVDIMSVKNSMGEITGYYFVNNPSKIYAIPKDFQPENFKSSSSNELVDLVGDIDGFGFNTTSNPPCHFFDLSTEEDLIGNFDRFIMGPSDEVKKWTHDFRDEFCSTYIIEEISLEIREYFNYGGDVKVVIDGAEFDLVQNGIISRCKGKTSIQTFTFSGEEVAFAQDGLVDVSIIENGDEVAIDYSLLRVSYSIPLPESSEITIGGCNTGVVNKLVDCNYLSATIDELAVSSETHGVFIRSLTQLTDKWIVEGVITASEKGAILSCAAQSKN